MRLFVSLCLFRENRRPGCQTELRRFCGPVPGPGEIPDASFAAARWRRAELTGPCDGRTDRAAGGVQARSERAAGGGRRFSRAGQFDLRILEHWLFFEVGPLGDLRCGHGSKWRTPSEHPNSH